VTTAWAAGSVLFAMLVSDLLTGAQAPRLLRALRLLEQGALMLIGGFVVASILVLINAVMDTGPATLVRAEVHDVGGVTLNMDRRIGIGRADIRRAEGGDTADRILLRAEERRTLFPGKAVVLHVRPGALGVPYVTRIEQDEAALARRALAIAPDARHPRRTLIQDALARRAWDEAAALSVDYVERFPMQEEAGFVSRVTNELGTARQYTPALAVAESLVARHPTGEFLGIAGWANHETQRYDRALTLLQSAVVKTRAG
jgi:hypothetical protein